MNDYKFARLILLLLLIVLVFFIVMRRMHAQTNTGPMRTPQINQQLYVGQSGYPTIQSAVTSGCNLTGHSYAVIILPGVTPSDTPTSPVGGCTGTYIEDRRSVPIVYYQWSGSVYVKTAGGALPATTNLIAGDGSGNGADSGIAAHNVALLNAANTFTQAPQTVTTGGNTEFHVLSTSEGAYPMYVVGGPSQTWGMGIGGMSTPFYNDFYIKELVSNTPVMQLNVDHDFTFMGNGGIGGNLAINARGYELFCPSGTALCVNDTTGAGQPVHPTFSVDNSGNAHAHTLICDTTPCGSGGDGGGVIPLTNNILQGDNAGGAAASFLLTGTYTDTGGAAGQALSFNNTFANGIAGFQGISQRPSSGGLVMAASGGWMFFDVGGQMIASLTNTGLNIGNWWGPAGHALQISPLGGGAGVSWMDYDGSMTLANSNFTVDASGNAKLHQLTSSKVSAGNASYLLGNGAPPSPLTQGQYNAWNFSQSSGESDFLNVNPIAGSPYYEGFRWYVANEGTSLNPNSPQMKLDSHGDLATIGSVSAGSTNSACPTNIVLCANGSNNFTVDTSGNVAIATGNLTLGGQLTTNTGTTAGGFPMFLTGMTAVNYTAPGGGTSYNYGSTGFARTDYWNIWPTGSVGGFDWFAQGQGLGAPNPNGPIMILNGDGSLFTTNTVSAPALNINNGAALIDSSGNGTFNSSLFVEGGVRSESGGISQLQNNSIVGMQVGVPSFAQVGTWMGWNFVSQGESDFAAISNGGANRFVWYSGPPGVQPTSMMVLDSSGNLFVRGTLNQGGIPAPFGGAASGTRPWPPPQRQAVASTLSPVPTKTSGKPSTTVATTPKRSRQLCRPNAMWHDADYIYVCVAKNEIKRAALSSFQ
jgi:hypothetical protein